MRSMLKRLWSAVWAGCVLLAHDPTLRGEGVRFSQTRGFYDSPLRLVLDTDLEAATIRYTLDGSAPTRSRGRLYAGPIDIDATSVVRALAYNSTAQSDAVATNTFLFVRQVPDQPAYPPGYLRSAFSIRQGAHLSFDYAMDPDVLRDKAANGDVARHLKAIPSLSIGLDRDDFNAIYARHQERGVAWERPASVELLYPDRPRYAGFAGFQVDCGIRMQGGLAVDQARKKSFRLLFKSRYGPAKLKYPLFESAVHHARSAVRRFDTVVLRAGGNTNWSKDDAWKHAPSTYLRDQFVRDTAIAMGGIGARGIFLHVYINGLYFGLYNLTERPDARFMAAYLGGDEEDYYSVNHHGTVSGDAGRWNRLMRVVRGSGRTHRGDDQGLPGAFDFANFSDYIILNWIVGMGDWPYNNWYAGLRNRPPGRVMFFCWDAEFAFWTLAGYQHSSPVAWVNPRFRSSSRPIPRVWRALTKNEDFLMTFADRVYKHCSPGGALTDAAMQARFRSLADAIEGAIVAESARWGDAAVGRENNPHTRRTDWYPNRDAVLKLMKGNTRRFMAALRAARYYPTIDPPVLPRPLPPVESGFEVTLRNPHRGGTVYYTVDGSDPRLEGTGAPSPRAFVHDGAEPLTLSETTRVKARVRRGRDWSALNDVFYSVRRIGLPLRITELMYHPPRSEACEFIEIQNVSSALVELTGVGLEGVDYQFPPGSALKGGEILVLVPNDDPGEFRRKYPGVDIFGTYRGHLSNAGEAVRLVAAEGVIAAVEFDDENGWPQPAAGGGHSLELIGAHGAAEGAEGWRASELPGGTPGRVARRAAEGR